MAKLIPAYNAQLPIGWDLKAIDELAIRVGSGVTPTGGSDVYRNEGVVFIRSQNVKNSGLDLNDVAFIDEETHRRMAASEVVPFDVLLNITGASIGRCCFVPKGIGRANQNQHVCTIRLPGKSEFDAAFLSSVLLSPIGQSQISQMNAGGNREGLNYQQLRAFEVVWPSEPAERAGIAKILLEVDRAIEQTESLIAKQQRIKDGMMQDLLTRGIDDQGNLRSEKKHEFKDSALGRIPIEWSIRTLDSISEFVTSGARGWAQHYSVDGAIFLRVGNLTRDHINMRFDDLVRVNPPSGSEGTRTSVKSGDVLISVTADLGMVGVIPDGFSEAYVNQHIALVRIKDDVIYPRFIGWFLQSRAGQRQFEKHNESGAKAGLNLPTVRTILVACPPATEQKRIADLLDRTTDAKMHSRLLVLKLQRFKAALMQDLLIGRKRVTALLDLEQGQTISVTYA